MQTRRLAVSFETYRVCRAYRTGENPAQSHVRLGIFFQKSPKPSGRQRVKNEGDVHFLLFETRFFKQTPLLFFFKIYQKILELS